MAAEKKEMKVVVSHKETIKPSSPTPSHLQNFNLSFLDLLVASHHSPFVSFYGGRTGSDEKSVSQRLKKSLSETLTRFYPWAGRSNIAADGHITINCNDEGVPYLEAHANFPIATFLQRPVVEELSHFIPTIPENMEFHLIPLLLVQVTFFDYGGFAIALLISHKVADAVSGYTFFEAWARATSGHPQDVVVVPDFSAPSLFPLPRPFPVKVFNSDGNAKACISRRFVIDVSKVKRLKDIAATDAVPHPTKTEVVSALFWKCFTKAATSRTSTSTSVSEKKSSFLTWIMNIRPNVTPPLPYYVMGNVLALQLFKQNEKSTEMMKEGGNQGSLQALVCQLREERKEIMKSLTENLRGGQENRISTFMSLFDDYTKHLAGAKENGDYWYTLSSLCGIDYYGIDFGLGKPIWLCIPLFGSVDSIMLMSSPDGGVEAWVTLPKEEIVLLEKDPDFLEFASINPSPLNISKETSHTRRRSAL